jgi:hypothetical protein
LEAHLFDVTPLTASQKIGVVFYGFLAGVAAIVVTTAISLMLCIAIAMLGSAGYLHLGEYGHWLPSSELGTAFTWGSRSD